ncbi:Protein vip1 [Diplodia seriata]|uniref:Protein vip1 n=1 Tax=Diplodia seriata TaxID=420778 RepID=A0A1S8BC73_9PEZI|nr:Protein vip1 [Diplodia seriata]
MASVHVENIASQTTEKEVRDFFSFCGKIQSLSVTPLNEGTQSATVTFEKETAAKTALLLDNTQLGPAQVKVGGRGGRGRGFDVGGGGGRMDGWMDGLLLTDAALRGRGSVCLRD